MDVDECLRMCANVRWEIGAEMPGCDPRFPTMGAAFEAALDGVLRPDDARFATLLSHALFAEETMHLPIPRQYFRGDFGAHSQVACEHAGFIRPWDRSYDMPLGTARQWLVRPCATDERWVGLTIDGVEAHTIDEWLTEHSSMIGEALRANVPADTLSKAALLSGDWSFLRAQIVTDPDDAWLMWTHRPWRAAWTVAYAAPRRRMRTRLSTRNEIAAKRAALGLE